MPRSARLSVAFALFLAALPLHAATKKLVIISIDGLRGITLASLSSRGLHTPNLNEFAAAGTLSDGLLGVYPTVTYPSHTTLITGVSPATHGILSNGMFDPEDNLNGAWYWYAQQIQRPTLYNAAHRKGLITAAVSWPVTVAAGIDFNFPEYREPETDADLLLYNSLCTPGLLDAYEKAKAPLRIGHIDDELRASQATWLIATHKPDLLFVHLIDMDHQQHVHGPDSPEAFHALENIDRLIGLIRQQAKTSEPSDEVDFLVVSDHGFEPATQQLNPDAVLNSLGLAGTEKAPESWRISAFFGGGSFGLVAHDPNDTDAIALATRTFEQLARDGKWGIDRLYNASETHGLHGYANAFASVNMKPGYTAGGSRTGPWLTQADDLKGMHGYAPGPPELDASFLAFGPGIPHQHIARAKLVDVAPTAAHILNLDLPDTEGENLLK